MTAIHQTREAWLTAAAQMMRRDIDHEIMIMDEAPKAIAFPDMDQRVGADGEPLPAMPSNLRVACSNPSGGIRNRMRGECVYPQSSADGSYEIWISPKMDDVETVLIVLLHELIHATLHSWAPGAGHGPRFWRLAKPLGFARPLTSATIATGPEGTALRGHLSRWAVQVGDYPHAGVNFAAHDAQRRRQSTRMLKAECMTDGCGFKVRMTRTWAQRATPLCPVCEGMGVHSRTAVVLSAVMDDASMNTPGASIVLGHDGDDTLIGLCNLAGMGVHPDGRDDAGAVERAAVLRAERDERERQAREAAERAAADARREAAAREAAATEAQAQRTANARAAGLGEAADLGVVEGQGVQNRYGAGEATRERRAAERAARPVPAFEGVAAGVATLRHLIGLALPAGSDDMNEVEDACRRYCDRHGIRPPARFPLAEAWRATGTPDVAEVPAEAPQAPAYRKAPRFANLELD